MKAEVKCNKVKWTKNVKGPQQQSSDEDGDKERVKAWFPLDRNAIVKSYDSRMF